jgi:hypothetical protein
MLFAMAQAQGQEPRTVGPEDASGDDVRIVYPKHTDLDFEGTDVDGELKRPAELYFQHRPSEKFDSLLKRRKEFHRAMLRDVMHE